MKLEKENEELKAKLEASEKACAEMRHVIEEFVGQHESCVIEECPASTGLYLSESALSSDAGKDYVHKSEVEKACAAWRSVVNDYAGHYNTCCTSESDNDDDCTCGYSKAWDSARGKK